MVRVAKLAGLRVPIDKTSTRGMLEQVLTNPDTGGRLPPLESAALAVQRMVDLGTPPGGQEVADALAPYQVGGEYRWSRLEDPDWAATARAVATLESVGRTPEASTVDSVAAALGGTANQPFILQQFANEVVPVWKAADIAVPAEVRAQFRPALASHLQAAIQSLGGSPDGPSLVLLAEVAAIAEANGFAVSIPVPQVRALVAPDGMLRASEGADVSDPQTTALALTLGWSPSETLAPALAVEAAPAGWLAVAPPDPEATYYGLQVSSALGLTSHRGEVGRWVLGLLASPPDPSAAGAARKLFFITELADALGLDLPQPFTLVAREAVQAGGEQRTDAAWGFRVRLAMRLGVAAPRIPDLGLRMTSLQAVWWTWLAGTVHRDPAELNEAAKAITALRAADGTFRSSPDAPPDVVSTATGATILQLGDAESARLGSMFASPTGYTLFAQDEPRGGPVNLRSIYLGMVLRGAISNPIVVE